MLLTQRKNLLPKGCADGVALKTSIPQPSFRFRGFRKLLKIFPKSNFTRVFLVGSAVLYLAGYQPVLAIPPLQKSLARADFAQQQNIEVANFPEPFALPHPGYLTTRFSSWHPGIDIATGYGMPIHPIAAGRVVSVTYGFFGLGHFVVVEHEQGFTSTYGHLGKIFAQVGDSVTTSSILGEVGMTGHTSGPHTHLEVTKNGQYLDPLTILPALSNWPAAAGDAPRGAGEVLPAKAKAEREPKPGKQTFNLIDIGKAGVQEPTDRVTPLLHLLPLQPGQNGPQTAPSPD